MITVRQIWGPFDRVVSRSVNGLEVKWSFFGIRNNYCMARWTLSFNIASGKYRAAGIAMRGSDAAIKASGNALIQGNSMPDPNLHNLFLSKPGGTIETGKCVDLLRKRLTTEDLSYVTRVKLGIKPRKDK